MANIKDVATRAGVSISTVSRVLNSTKKVSPDLEKRVMDAVNELGYSANIFAKGLKGTKSGIIAVVLTAISRTFFTTILEGIHEIAEEEGYSILITETYDDVEREMHLMDELAAQWVDGIILGTSANQLEADEKVEGYINRLHLLTKKEKNIPIVTLEYPVNNPHVDAIVIDSEKAAYEATTRLIETFGRKNLVHISLPETHYLGKKRIDGFLRAMKEHGMTPDENTIITGVYTPYSGFQAAEKLFASGKKVDGIFCANDEMAVGVLKACAKRGIKIPEEIAIIGNDDIFAASIVSPTLSSIRVPKKEMGRAAARKLIDRIQTGVVPEERDIVELDYRIIDRQTTIRDDSVGFKYLEW